MKVKVVNLSKKELPQYETEGSVGMDLRAWVSSKKTKVISNGFIQSRDGHTQTIYIRPMGRAIIDAGIAIQLPEGVEAQIRNRSGVTLKHGVVAQLGTIDSDYRGHVCVIIINFGEGVFEIEDGERIAQIVFNKTERCEWDEVKQLDESQRGEGGLGHTGTK